MIKVVKNSLIRNRKVKKHSKRYKKNKEIVLNKKDYSLSEAIKTLKSINKVKFDESIEIAVVLNKEKTTKTIVIFAPLATHASIRKPRLYSLP